MIKFEYITPEKLQVHAHLETIKFKTEANNVADIVDNFTRFMLAIGYQKETVMDCMAGFVMTYDDEEEQ